MKISWKIEKIVERNDRTRHVLRMGTMKKFIFRIVETLHDETEDMV